MNTLRGASESLFGTSIKLRIRFADAESRKTVSVKIGNKQSEQLLFGPHDAVRGVVHVDSPGGRRLEHTGIRLELIGQIESLLDRTTHEFTSLVRELAEPGEVGGHTEYPFEFAEVEKPYESYDGIHMRLRYLLRITVARSYGSKVVHEETFRVYTAATGEEEEGVGAIKMEVGIEDCLHIEFEYNKSRYHLRDVVLGRIFFLLVRIRIKHMELAIIKRESSGTGANAYNESDTVAKYEIMDGAPVRGESIPIRLFLAAFDQLTPTFKNVNNKFSVRYFLNLVLVDEEDRRYFKQQEVTFYRQPLR